jgi:DNA repair protein RadA/Sms
MSYVCSHCHRLYQSFHLSCPDCGKWKSFVSQSNLPTTTDSRPISLPKIRSSALQRTRTNIREVDKILGGGFVPGSSVLLVGPPGVGKSTFIMQVLERMNTLSVYVTGEESVDQMKIRAHRLRIRSKQIFLLFETNVNKIVMRAEEMATQALIVDSIQTVYTDTSDTLPGSSTQIRKCTYILRRLAQRRNCVLGIIGQVTKDRSTAGPKLLEHAVDVVLHLELQEDTANQRLLYATKNRFGSTLPRCVLSMGRTGLQFQDPVK